MKIGIAIRNARTSILWIVLALLLLGNLRTGPDFDRYYQWAEAFRTGDIFRIAGDVLSPLGVPLSQWSFGPGLVLALAPGVGSDDPRLARWGCLAWGGLFAIVFWVAMYRLLLRATEGNQPLTRFGMALAFVGTHLGLYSIAIGSESLSYPCIALLALRVSAPRQASTLDHVVDGMLAGLLVSIRPQLGLYLLPLAGVAAHSILKRSEAVGRKLVRLGLSAIPLALALLEVAVTNRWMTGSPLRFPYLYGGGEFRSIDLANPELAAVVIHPWHGLLTYHPCYLLLLGVLLAMALRHRGRREGAFCLALAAAVAAHLYLQAAWYVWWLGLGTFGMRALGICSVLLVPMFCRHLAVRRTEGKSNTVLIGGTLLACVFSYLLLLQAVEANTQFYDYKQLVSAQLRAALHFTHRRGAVIGMILVAASCAWLARHHRAATKDALLWSTIVLFALAILCLTGQFTSPASSIYRAGFMSGPLSGGWRIGAFVATWVLLAMLPQMLFDEPAGWHPAAGPTAVTTVDRALTIGVAAVFVLGLLPFSRLAARTELRIAEGIPPPRAFAYQSAVHFEEVEASYREYLRVKGFEEKKRALAAFIEESKAAAKR
jgi:hypothetical protein